MVGAIAMIQIIYNYIILKCLLKSTLQDLKQYLDSSKNGVVYVSFGTNVDSTMLPAEKVQVLVRAFSKLPYDILFKWDNEELPGRSDNVKISKWLPQSDLLSMYCNS